MSKWVFEHDDSAGLFMKDRWVCPVCGSWQTYGETKFCPDCGADMRDKEDANE